jgi:hypothetical protein
VPGMGVEDQLSISGVLLLLVVLLLKTGSYYVTQLAVNSCLSLPSAGITGVHHETQLYVLLLHHNVTLSFAIH